MFSIIRWKNAEPRRVPRDAWRQHHTTSTRLTRFYRILSNSFVQWSSRSQRRLDFAYSSPKRVICAFHQGHDILFAAIEANINNMTYTVATLLRDDNYVPNYVINFSWIIFLFSR